MPHLSPYKINSAILEMINELENEFSVHIEKNILSKLNLLDLYPDMSKYQLSLTKKRLADCYKSYGITGNALEMYHSALSDNKNLSVKKIIKELSSMPQCDLIYSVDIHFIYKEDTPNRIQNRSSEYDPEYEQRLHTAMGKLGKEYQDGFYYLRKVHDFYSSIQDNPSTITDNSSLLPSVKKDRSSTLELTGMTEEEYLKMRDDAIKNADKYHNEHWDEITAKSMVKSKIFSDKHEDSLNDARNLLLDGNTLAPAPCFYKFSESDLLFVKYLHHKSISLDYIPGYFTHEYNTDYRNVICAAFSIGYLKYAPASFTLSKMKVSELKEFLSSNGIKTFGKKEDLINIITSSLDIKCFEKKYYELTQSGKEATGYIDYYNKN